MSDWIFVLVVFIRLFWFRLVFLFWFGFTPCWHIQHFKLFATLSNVHSGQFHGLLGSFSIALMDLTFDNSSFASTSFNESS